MKKPTAPSPRQHGADRSSIESPAQDGQPQAVGPSDPWYGQAGESRQGWVSSKLSNVVGEPSSDDRRLLAAVEDAVKTDETIDLAAIRITVRDGTVTLRGTVMNDAQKRRLERMSRSVPGVRLVESDVEIGRAGGPQP